MANNQPETPAMVSDGRRMRAVWRPEHGNGDSIQHIIDRCKTTVGGHPTWKIFIGDIPEPIVRGGDEPPRYAYLDDRACYVIWKSKQYTNDEMKVFWPFDFDHQGNIKAGRMNRGHVAWTDSEEPEIAKGKMRGKDKWYEFSGEPEVTEYKPLRPVGKTKMDLIVEAEWAALKAQEAAATNGIEGTPDPPTPRKTRLEKVVNLRDSPPKYPPPPPLPPRQKQKQWQTPGRPIPAQSIKDGVKPRPLPSRVAQGPTLAGDEAFHTRASLSPATSRRNSLSIPATPPPKRKATGPFIDSSSPSQGDPSPPEAKRTKLGERPSSLPAALPPTVASAGSSEGPLNAGERASSLPVEVPELVPDVDSDESDEEDEFLANIGKSLSTKCGQV